MQTYRKVIYSICLISETAGPIFMALAQIAEVIGSNLPYFFHFISIFFTVSIIPSYFPFEFKKL